jgi:HK97 family phage portal protein
MGILPSLIERRSTWITDDFYYTTAPGPSSEAGVRVDEKTALKYLTVYACVSLIAGDVGRLPLNLYRKRSDGGKETVTDHPLYDLLHNAPNPEMTSFHWREASQGHLLLWGNHFSFIERAKNGQIIGLWPLPDPGRVNVRRLNDQLVYEYTVEGEQVRRRRDQIFHIPGYGFNGLVGMSMISLAREAVGMGLAAEQFGSRYFGEGTHPSGLLSLPAEVDLGDNEEKYKDAIRSQYSGLGKSHTLMVLQNGEEYKPLTIPLDDAQFLETRDHQKVEVCGMYHVPPHKIALHGQNSNYNNLEQENSSYVDSCLMHWLVRWESTISQQLLTPEERKSGLFFEFLVQGLLRGDSKARSDYYMKMFQTGAMSPNDILAKENLNPIDGGEKHFVQLNMIPLDQAGEIQQTAPTQETPKIDTKEEVEAEKKASAQFFSRSDRKFITEKRSIQHRDRIARRYHPLFVRAAGKIVNREGLAVKRQVKKEMGERATGDMAQWLDEFYRNMPEYIKDELGPVFISFADAIIDAAVGEIGLDDPPDMRKFVSDYIDVYAKRHVGSSLGQLRELLEGELTELENRVDEWAETRPEKIATNETVRGSSAVYQAVAFSAGLATVWRIRGAETCPYCQELNGRRVRSGEFFAVDGDKIDPSAGDGPMKIYGMRAHPPLHQGCDCYLTTG